MTLWAGFDTNEICLLIMLLLAYGALFLLPKKFTRDITLLFSVWGVSFGFLFDFTIGGGIINFYIINDSPDYELFDILYYLLFAPSSYIFIYFYEVFRSYKNVFLWYIAIFSLVGVGVQTAFTWLEIINFKNGYQPLFSFAVFLTIQSITILYFEFIYSKFNVYK
ncbi:hypothetical protein [Salibacterium qingdaonense]|uniref:Uncharacterized protein n=1 Tax=Salibacterium qingdaonense TaxID=266892 RepID=A0A1I4IRJ6_9BACI|nr:hypothetical protein [Salibacterium qingdaonense]SFL56687.1 hypothetical protein SAMN04488054_102181 [Salibacterium qingdaonense]